MIFCESDNPDYARYSVTVSMTGCLPDAISGALTLKDAMAIAKEYKSSYMDAWQYSYDHDKGKDVKNPHFKVRGNARDGYTVYYSKYGVIHISINDIRNERIPMDDFHC